MRKHAFLFDLLIAAMVFVVLAGCSSSDRSKPSPTPLSSVSPLPPKAPAEDLSRLSPLPTVFPVNTGPDRSLILFSSDRTGQIEFYLMDMNGKIVGTVAPPVASANAMVGRPIWAPQQNRYLFVVQEGGNRDIYAMDWDATTTINLTANLEIPAADPAPSPDGRWIAFLGIEAGGQELMIMRSDGQDIRNLSNYVGMNANIAWSPDSQKIFHNSNRSGSPNIYFIRPDGSDLTNVTKGPGLDSTYTLSPDGAFLAFISDREGFSDLFLIDSNGTGEAENLTRTDGKREMDPAWSPDGKYIAYLLRDDEDQSIDIFLLNTDNRDVTQLTQTPHSQETSLVWSGGGKYLFFVADLEQQRDIFRLDVDTLEIVNLTDHPANDFGPFWISPVGD